MTEPTVAELLEFEAQHHTTGRARKAEAVRIRFGLPHVRYVQLLNRAVRSREGIETDPMLARQVRDRIDRGVQRRRELLGSGRRRSPVLPRADRHAGQ